MKRSISCLFLALTLVLAACGTQPPAQQPANIFEQAVPVPTLLAEAIALDTQFDLSTLTSNPDNFQMFTITSADVLGEPLSNITFLAPTTSTDLWDFADTLTGNEWGDAPLDSDWRTIITGASTIRDVVVADLPGLHMLLNLRDTLNAAGTAFADAKLIGANPSTLLLEMNNQYWDIAEQRPLTDAEFNAVLQRYTEIVTHNSEPGALDDVRAAWEELYEENTLWEQTFGIPLDNLSKQDGRLNISAAVSLAENELGTTAYTDHGRRCAFLGMFCSHKFTGSISNANQATQGGYEQNRSDYGMGNTPTRFNSITCGGNNPVNGVAALGCGPSAFIGLIGEKYKNHNIAVAGRCVNPATNSSCTISQTYDDFTRWMVAEIGVNGRPRIADYMGTCNIGNNEGLTLLSGFTNGIQDFLQDTNTNLTLNWRAGIGGATGWNQSAAANIINVQVGVNENPVVATYWPSAVSAHYAPIKEYDILWSAGVSIIIRTTDGGNTWFTLGGTWSGQEGVYYLD